MIETKLSPTLLSTYTYFSQNPQASLVLEKLVRSLGVRFLHTGQGMWYAVPEEQLPSSWTGRDYTTWLSQLAASPYVAQIVDLPDVPVFGTLLDPSIPVVSPQNALAIAYTPGHPGAPQPSPAPSPVPTWVWPVVGASIALVVLAVLVKWLSRKEHG
ncbi:MAG: hypothetical protein QXK45_02795 [Thermofilaceae archaeon]